MVFCGRIIMFLAHFFPLSERSGCHSYLPFCNNCPCSILLYFECFHALGTITQLLMNVPMCIVSKWKFYKKLKKKNYKPLKKPCIQSSLYVAPFWQLLARPVYYLNVFFSFYAYSCEYKGSFQHFK